MTEHMSHPEPHPLKLKGEGDTVTQRIRINGLPMPQAFSDETGSYETDIQVPDRHAFNTFKPESLTRPHDSEVFQIPSVPSRFDVDQRAPKAEIAAQKATMINGEPVESESSFPGTQKAEEMPIITTRAEAKRQKGRHAHETRHAAPKESTLFTPEQLQTARERVLRVMGAASVLKDELLGGRDLHAGDNGENETYVGRHRPGNTRNERKAPRTNRIKRAAHRLATLIDNKIYDNFVEKYPTTDTEEVEIEETSHQPAEGETIVFNGHEWEVVNTEDGELTIQRLTDDDEIEVETISFEEYADNTQAANQSHADDTDVIDNREDTRSKFQKLRDLPLAFAANRATRRHMRLDALTDEQLDDRRRYRRLAMLGAVGVATFFAVKYGHDHLWGSANDAASTAGGGGNKLQHLPLNGSGDKLHHLPLEHGGSAAEFSTAAEHISRGEGLYQTMKEMGIPRDKWATVLEKAGPKLVKMHAAYRDEKIGGFGWSKPGAASRAALRVLADTYKSVK